MWAPYGLSTWARYQPDRPENIDLTWQSIILHGLPTLLLCRSHIHRPLFNWAFQYEIKINLAMAVYCFFLGGRLREPHINLSIQKTYVGPIWAIHGIATQLDIDIDWALILHRAIAYSQKFSLTSVR